MFKDPRKPYWPLIPVLILLVIVMGWMMNHMPPADLAPYGYSSVIIAMEFVFNPTDVQAVLGPLTSAQLDGLDMVNNIDFAYMVLYSALLAGFFYITRGLEGHRWLTLGMGLAGAALFSDLFENFQLLDLTEMYRAETNDEGYSSLLSNLFLFTSLKWGALAISMALAIPVLIKRGIFSKVIAVLLALPFILMISALINLSSGLIDMFTNSIVFGFLALAVYIIAYRHPLISTDA